MSTNVVLENWELGDVQMRLGLRSPKSQGPLGIGEVFYLQLELFCLQLSFFAYSLLRCFLDALPTVSKEVQL